MLRVGTRLKFRQGINSNHNVFAVLEIGTAKIACLIAQIDPVYDNFSDEPVADRIHIIGVGFQQSAGMKSGVVIDMEAVEQSIRSTVSQAEQMAGMTVDDVIIAVNCGRIRSESFSATEPIRSRVVTERDIDRVFNAGYEYSMRDERRVLHLNPISYAIDDNLGIKDPTGMIGGRLSVDLHSVTADEGPVRNIMLAVERCHLTVIGIVVAPYASGLAAVGEDEANLGVACIDIGYGTTSISVFNEGHFIYADSVAMGGNQITLDIARNLPTPVQEAERIKVLHGNAISAASDDNELIAVPNVGDNNIGRVKLTKAQLSMLIRPRLEDLFLTIFDRLEASGVSQFAGQRIVLTGGASQLAGVPEFASRLLGKSCRLGRPRVIAGLPDYANGPEFSVPVGLLLYPFQPYAIIGAVEKNMLQNTGTDYVSRVRQWFRESF